MAHFFEHTPQATNQVNQVENLATEVSEAFDIVEEILHIDSQENASITSSIGSLDNKYIKEYVPNKGWINNYKQQLYFPTNSQSASLDLYPSFLVEDLNTVSITNITTPSKTYVYKHNGVLENSTDFTFNERKVILGGAPLDSETLLITYKGFNTTTPEDNQEWPFELKYNVLQIKQYDNSIIKEFTATDVGNVYTITGYDFKALCSTFIQNVINNNPQDLDKYVTFYSAGDKIQAYDIEITNTHIRFVSDDAVINPIKIYVANASLGKLIECLYRLFYAHDHGSNGGQGVNHGSILGLYENTDRIKYQNTAKKNYDHPQYLNREGYINDTTVYNNAFLGDFLLASTSETNRRNNLEGNSVKLVFGEYNSGSRFYYNTNDDCLWLDSVSKDGIKLVTPKDKKALSINSHSFVDTNHISNDTDRALKLTLKSESEEELGVFKLTRKVDKDGLTIDDDKAKLLSYSAEFSLVNIKENLIIANGSKVSFGDPSIIELVLEEDGLHFKTEDGVLSDLIKVNFDIPVKAKTIEVEHLDAKNIHLTEDQKLVFGNDAHDIEQEQYVNFEENKLKIKTIEPVLLSNNGRRRGVSLDDRSYIYASTPQGFNINDRVEYTDIYIESKRDIYFIASDYNYVAGITNLQQVERANTYANIGYVNNLYIEYDTEETNGILLNSNNKIFAQQDNSSNISTILQSNNGVIVASSYNPTGPVINYGKITAKTFIAEGSENTDAGFYGNVNIPVNHKLTINGQTEFNSELTFNKPVTFTDNVRAATIVSNLIRTNDLEVSDKATYNNVEVLEELRFSTMLQTNRVANSEFEGTVQFNNNVTLPDSNTFIVLGNKDIEDDRKSSGLFLNHKEVRLGVNGTVSAGKVFASKGTPSGNGDTTGGFSFASTNGFPDGDTGMFCEGAIEEQNNSDIVFRIDGVEKGRITKEPIDLSSLDYASKGKAFVTLDMMLNQLGDITGSVLSSVYPIGTIYENSVDGRNPAVILNWPSSVWRRYAVGRSLLGAAGTDPGETVDEYLEVPADLNVNAAGTKYGAYQHQLTLAESPKHRHKVKQSGDENNVFGAERAVHIGGSTITEADYPKDLEDVSEEGGDLPHNNTHPIIVTHIWERIG